MVRDADIGAVLCQEITGIGCIRFEPSHGERRILCLLDLVFDKGIR